MYGIEHFYVIFCTMISPAGTERIRAEIKWLEQARSQCNDRGIQQRIDLWIEEQEHKLEQLIMTPQNTSTRSAQKEAQPRRNEAPKHRSV